MRIRLLLPVVLAFLAFPTFGQNWTQPPAGQFCPPGFTYDAANCALVAAPSGSNPTISGTSFVYSSGSGCLAGFSASGGQCVRQVPAGYAAFVYNDTFYVKPNLHFVRQLDPTCPTGSGFDNANCFFGTAPVNTNAGLYSGFFVFSKWFFQTCTVLRPGSWQVSPAACAIAPIPVGWQPFVYQNSWYVRPKWIFNGVWLARDYMTDGAQYHRPVCLASTSSPTWQLLWSDEFNDAPDNQQCFTSDDRLRCILRPDWSVSGACEDAPIDWTASATWTPQQVTRFTGIRNLNKCRWSVYESFNAWDVWTTPRIPMAERTNSYRPENITVANGVLTVRTRDHPASHPGDGYCCGKQIEPDPPNHGELFTQDCPYSGALLSTTTGLPWTQGNSPTDPNPDKRYVGFGAPPGRIEFRARMTKLGHGGWMSLWMFGDQVASPPAGELDAVEFIADSVPDPNEPVIVQGIPEQIVKQSSTYGMAYQTAHNWYPQNANPNHVGSGIGIPIGLGEWHTYAVEWIGGEVRFFTDGCITHRLVEGQLVTDRWTGATHPFHVPVNQTMSIIIGAPASASYYFPAWYRAYQKQTDACGNGTSNCATADPFSPSEMEVDYVRVYIDPLFPDPSRKAATTPPVMRREGRRLPLKK